MKGNKIIELQIGFHSNKARRYQRVITNEFFDEYKFEHQSKDNKFNITYSANKPPIKDEKVSIACDNMELVLESAKINYESKDRIASTIRDGKIITGDDMDIWKDIKVWILGVYPKYQSNILHYKKISTSSRYIKDGFTEDKLITDKIYCRNGEIVSFTIESHNMSNRYTAIIDGFNRYKFETYSDGFSGRYHGYYYFDNFKQVQEFFKTKYNKILVQKGETEVNRY